MYTSLNSSIPMRVGDNLSIFEIIDIYRSLYQTETNDSLSRVRIHQKVDMYYYYQVDQLQELTDYEVNYAHRALHHNICNRVDL